MSNEGETTNPDFQLKPVVQLLHTPDEDLNILEADLEADLDAELEIDINEALADAGAVTTRRIEPASRNFELLDASAVNDTELPPINPVNTRNAFDRLVEAFLKLPPHLQKEFLPYIADAPDLTHNTKRFPETPTDMLAFACDEASKNLDELMITMDFDMVIRAWKAFYNDPQCSELVKHGEHHHEARTSIRERMSIAAFQDYRA